MAYQIPLDFAQGRLNALPDPGNSPWLLFVAQGDDRVDAGGAAGREKTG